MRADVQDDKDERQAVDLAAVLDRIDGDRELLKELVSLYLEDERRLYGEIEDAVRSRNATALSRAAHTLKGAVSNFSAPRAQAAAFALESAGREGRLDDAAAGLGALDLELRRVREALSALVN